MLKNKKIFSGIIIPLIALAALGFMIFQMTKSPKNTVASPAFAPSESDYNLQVAGVGLVEPQSEMIKIVSNISGVITNVYVEAGRKVATGDKLFTIDEREAKAQLSTARAAYGSASARLADSEQKLAMYQKLSDKRAVSEQEISDTKYAAEIAEADLRQAAARIQEVKTTIDRLTVTAPMDGEILKVNARLGEFAVAGITGEPLITMGNTDIMHLRVEIDETDAQRFHIENLAKAILRSNPNSYVDLNFIMVEPLVRPKKNLTGNSNEKVDTRVLEVIYSFDNTKLHAYPGQQMDVYISAQ